MSELDGVLQRQLKRLGVDANAPPTEAVWRKLLQRISEHYTLLEDNRSLLVRSMEVSSREMNDLRQRVEGQRDDLKEAIFAVNETLLAFATIVQESSAAGTDPDTLAEAKHRLSLRIGRLFPESAEHQDSAEVTGMKTSLMRLADQLLRLLSSSVETVRLRKELEVTRTVQEMLVPVLAEGAHASFDYAADHASAASCGGDFWMVRALSPDRVFVFVADATGHGVPSAVLTATVKGAVEALCSVYGAALEPRAVMHQLDALVAQVGKGQLFVTASAALFDQTEKRATFVSAGHPLPLLRRGGEVRPVVLHGQPLGSGGLTGSDVHVQALDYLPDDAFCWYTDGLVEAEDEHGEAFSERRLRSVFQRGAARSASDARQLIAEALTAFRGDKQFDDDRTLVVATMR